jgi:hypothetical protein
MENGYSELDLTETKNTRAQTAFEEVLAWIRDRIFATA